MRRDYIKRISASSYYQSAKYGDSLNPGNLLLDHTNSGGWLTDVDAWEMSWLQFDFEEPVMVSALNILNGFIDPEQAKKRDDYYFHLRPKTFRISSEHNEEIVYENILADIKDLQMFKLNFPAKTKSIKMTFVDAYHEGPVAGKEPFPVLGLRQIKWVITH